MQDSSLELAARLASRLAESTNNPNDPEADHGTDWDYRYSSEYFDDQITSLLQERFSKEFKSSGTHHMKQVFDLGIASIREGTPSETFLAFLDLIAEDAPAVLDKAVRETFAKGENVIRVFSERKTTADKKQRQLVQQWQIFCARPDQQGRTEKQRFRQFVDTVLIEHDSYSDRRARDILKAHRLLS